MIVGAGGGMGDVGQGMLGSTFESNLENQEGGKMEEERS